MWDLAEEDDGVSRVTQQVTQQVTPQVTPQVTIEIGRLIAIMNGEKKRDELQEILKLKDRENFRKQYLNEALKLDIIEMTIPAKPNSRLQKYRLTEKAKTLKNNMKNE